MKRVAAAGRLEDYLVNANDFFNSMQAPRRSVIDGSHYCPGIVRVRSVGGVGARVRIPGAVGRYTVRSIHNTHEGRMAILADKNGSEFAYPYWDLHPLD